MSLQISAIRCAASECGFFFWSVFSRTRTESEDITMQNPRIQSDYMKKRARKIFHSWTLFT